MFSNGIGTSQQTVTAGTSSVAAVESPLQTRAASEIASNTPAQLDVHSSLSSAAGLVSQALEGSDVRSEKVAALQQAIAGGSYNVSSSDVADKVIQSISE